MLNPLVPASAPHKNFQLQIVTSTSPGNVSSVSPSADQNNHAARAARILQKRYEIHAAR